ncbi:hypothetical protein VNO77_16991 [Canavalia gladiata]|uniref:F-box domain-containing protein n=1 Tax=Canavalia gladiata TaxID=3824 RepID=A0AAN9LIB0_CANGL
MDNPTQLSDGLWEKHTKQKWGKVLGDAACREWQWHVTTIMNKQSPLLQLNGEGLLGSFSGFWPLLSLVSYLENPEDLTSLLLSNCSMMALYISLQSGRFWFPAQVYMCAKLCAALLSYDYITNTFRARKIRIIAVVSIVVGRKPFHLSFAFLGLYGGTAKSSGTILVSLRLQEIIMSSEKNSASKLEMQEDCKVCSLLDLPGWTLDCILERLSPPDLCRMAQVCTSLRNRSRSDALWEKQVKHKWGRVLSDVAHQEWQWHTAKINTQSLLLQQIQNGSFGSFSGVWPFLIFHSFLENFVDLITLFKNCSRFALYICLESGRFWFPVQVYQIGSLSCYDAIVSYDSRTDTFSARSPTGGWRMIEDNIVWDRLRLSPVDTSPMVFYRSNCLNNLKPGDQIEIQIRRCREHPYEWWYAVVGHLESCEQGVNHCTCQYSDMLLVEFRFYQPHRRWKKAMLSRKMHEEEGPRHGLFGGIRKLEKEEIERWNTISLLLDS